MRCARINQRRIYYATYLGRTDVVDASGYDTGESVVSYSTPVEIMANVSPATGETDVAYFGNDLTYDRVIIIDDPNTPINEQSVMVIDRDLAFDASGNLLFDYVVKRVARHLQFAVIAVSKVGADTPMR